MTMKIERPKKTEIAEFTPCVRVDLRLTEKDVSEFYRWLEEVNVGPLFTLMSGMGRVVALWLPEHAELVRERWGE